MRMGRKKCCSIMLLWLCGSSMVLTLLYWGRQTEREKRVRERVRQTDRQTERGSEDNQERWEQTQRLGRGGGNPEDFEQGEDRQRPINDGATEFELPNSDKQIWGWLDHQSNDEDRYPGPREPQMMQLETQIKGKGNHNHSRFWDEMVDFTQWEQTDITKFIGNHGQ